MAFRSNLMIRGQLLTRSVSNLYSSGRTLGTSAAVYKQANIDKEATHTGQQFEKDDYRMVRFVDKQKHVNKKFAIDLIAEVPPAVEKSRVVSCDGGGGPLGHPKVYINLDQPGNHSCGYCGLRFTKKDSH